MDCHDHPPGILLRSGRGSQALSLGGLFELLDERPTFRILASLVNPPSVLRYDQEINRQHLRRPANPTPSAMLAAVADMM